MSASSVLVEKDELADVHEGLINFMAGTWTCTDHDVTLPVGVDCWNCDEEDSGRLPFVEPG